MCNFMYILGGGGHGKVVIDALLRKGLKVTGILDAKIKPSAQILGVPVLGGDEYLDTISISRTSLVNGVGANPKTATRKKLFSAMKLRGFQFYSVIHPQAIVSNFVEIGEGCQIMAGAVVQCGVKLDNNIVINTRASIDHDSIIESHAFIAPGVTICGNVKVNSSAFIGAGAVILPSVSIGRDSIVGAGALVAKSVPNSWIVAGNPAIKIGIND